MNRVIKETFNSLVVAVWFMFLTFPIMAVKVNTVEKVITWRLINVVYVGICAFVLSFFWHYLMKKRLKKKDDENTWQNLTALKLKQQKKLMPLLAAVVIAAAIAFPLVFSGYQVSVVTTALMYVVLGLGLNIEVGLAGLLDLGYVAFYAVGAYTYALLYHHFGISFWIALPLGAILAAIFGVLLGLPVLRLRGDYLAIVTLGFAEIIRLVLNNWSSFSMGPSGIADIAQPSVLGKTLTLKQSSDFLYYIMIVLVILTIFVVGRLRNSRIGRAWIAMREDETACRSMGINITRAKLTAFALGATWAGMMGCVFAAKTTFVNPASFTFWESIIILSIVVLGGMGSIAGVILGAFILILLPEYLQSISQIRMLIFGACMVLMMVFRPQGIISGIRQHYRWKENT
ncbi:MAG TPA: branched-chain amino acid ABC transporter permease [Desulfomonilia bacterium]